MAKAKAKTPAKAKAKSSVNTKPLEAIGFTGVDVESFLESFGYDSDKDDVKEFCKSTWGIKL